jgi:hypothetical protein
MRTALQMHLQGGEGRLRSEMAHTFLRRIDLLLGDTPSPPPHRAAQGMPLSGGRAGSPAQRAEAPASPSQRPPFRPASYMHTPVMRAATPSSAGAGPLPSGSPLAVAAVAAVAMTGGAPADSGRPYVPPIALHRRASLLCCEVERGCAQVELT